MDRRQARRRHPRAAGIAARPGRGPGRYARDEGRLRIAPSDGWRSAAAPRSAGRSEPPAFRAPARYRLTAAACSAIVLSPCAIHRLPRLSGGRTAPARQNRLAPAGCFHGSGPTAWPQGARSAAPASGPFATPRFGRIARPRTARHSDQAAPVTNPVPTAAWPRHMAGRPGYPLPPTGHDRSMRASHGRPAARPVPSPRPYPARGRSCDRTPPLSRRPTAAGPPPVHADRWKP